MAPADCRPSQYTPGWSWTGRRSGPCSKGPVAMQVRGPIGAACARVPMTRTVLRGSHPRSGCCSGWAGVAGRGCPSGRKPMSTQSSWPPRSRTPPARPTPPPGSEPAGVVAQRIIGVQHGPVHAVIGPGHQTGVAGAEVIHPLTVRRSTARDQSCFEGAHRCRAKSQHRRSQVTSEYPGARFCR